MSGIAQTKHSVTTTKPTLDLLCEVCGYVLEGSPADSNCPECGTPVERSLPANRVGTPWQRQPSAMNLFKTAVETLTSPRAMYRNCRMSYREGRRIEQVYIAIAVLSFALSFPVVGLLQLLILGHCSPGYLDIAIPIATAGWAILTLLTWIERRGIRLWGKVHRRRITPAVAATICGHAAVGWTICGLITGSGTLIFFARGILGYDIATLGLWLIPVGAITGLLTFEILTYIGLRQCRFANHPEPTPNPTSPSSKPPT